MRTLSIATLIVLTGVTASAQTTIYSDGFDGRRPAWRTSGLWAADETPTSVPGGSAYSGTRSLNFNNGTDYAGMSRGAAASPEIPIAPGTQATVRFRCNYQTETTGTRYDQRSVVLLVDSNVVQRTQLAGNRSTPAPGRCGAMGTWHVHELPLRVPATATRLRIEVEFDSVDDYANAFAGWFVDDVEVIGTPPAPQVFDAVSRTTRNFQQVRTEIQVDAQGAAVIYRSSPTARYAPVYGQATAAELSALEDAIRAGNLATVDSVIPDPNVYIVAPTTMHLVVTSQNAANAADISSSLGVYGQWAPQVQPVMTALEAILNRLLQPAPAGDDHGDTRQTATALNVDPLQAPTSGSIDPAADVDFFKVTDLMPVIMIYPPPQTTYVIETTVLGNMDTVIELQAADGTVLATNDDGGQGLASRIVHTTTHGAELYVKVRHYSSSGTGDYTIQATRGSSGGGTPPAADDHGNTPQDATTLEVGGVALSGDIDPAGDVDFFQLQQMVIMIYPPPTFTYVFETTVTGGMDTILEVYAQDGTTLLGSNDDASGLGFGSRVTLTAQAGTVGFVKVRHYNSSSGTGSYTVIAKTQ